MLGFSSISELAIAQLPGAFVHLSGVNTTGIAGDETVVGTAVVSGFSACNVPLSPKCWHPARIKSDNNQKI